MKITYKGDYALKAMLELSIRYIEEGGQIVSINELAKIGDMPTKFLEQILLMLRRGGFVKSRRGIRGGFLLARHPREITVGQVIRFVDGPIEPISCVENEHYKGCKDVKCCMFRSIWKDVSNAISVVVDTVTFEELVMRYKEQELNKNTIYEYSI